MTDVMKRLSLKMEVANILQFFVMLFFVINLVGSLLALSSTFDISGNQGWIQDANLEDTSSANLYITSMYFAIMICTTVGYGDLETKNYFEKSLVCLVIILGVAYFSFILSNLANQFSELQREKRIKEHRNRAIDDMEKRFKVDGNTMKKIRFFFKEHDSNLDLSNNLEMSYLLRILPTNLKT